MPLNLVHISFVAFGFHCYLIDQKHVGVHCMLTVPTWKRLIIEYRLYRAFPYILVWMWHKTNTCEPFCPLFHISETIIGLWTRHNACIKIDFTSHVCIGADSREFSWNVKRGAVKVSGGLPSVAKLTFRNRKSKKKELIFMTIHLIFYGTLY